MDVRIGDFFKRTFINAFTSPETPTEPVSQQGTHYAGTGQYYSNSPQSNDQNEKPTGVLTSADMGQYIEDSGEIDLVQHPTKHARSVLEMNYTEECESEAFHSATEQHISRSQCFLAEVDVAEGIPTEVEDPEQGTPYTNGPSRAFLSNDGQIDCMAMFITQDMVIACREIKEAKLLAANGIQAIKAAEKEFQKISREIGRKEEELREEQALEENDQTWLELEELQVKLTQAEQRLKKLKKHIRPYESNLERSRDELEELFGGVLQSEGLLEEFNPDPELLDDMAAELTGGEDVEVYGWVPSNTENPQTALEELLKQEAQENLGRSLGDLMDAQAIFDDRHAHYKRELAKFRQPVEMGTMGNTLTDFDLYEIQRVQGLTRDLIIAEETYKTAKMQARGLGLLQFDPYQASDFADRDDDGYRESEEAEAIADVDSERIKRWRSGVMDAQRADPEDDETVDVDDWDAESVGLEDSASMIDFERYCNKISLWEKHCSVLRQESANHAQAEDLWVVDARSLQRRRPC